MKQLILIIIVVMILSGCSTTSTTQKSVVSSTSPALITNKSTNLSSSNTLLSQKSTNEIQKTLPQGDTNSIWFPNHSDQEHGSGYVFINKNIGWNWSVTGKGMGDTADIEIKKTTDGGATWSIIAKTIASDITGLSFISEKVGWMTGNTSADGTISLAETVDGGAHWTFKNIKAPSLFKHEYFNTTPVVFFSSKDGILYVRGIYGKNHLFYITHDSGNHWTPVVNKLKESSKKLILDFSNEEDLHVTYEERNWESKDCGFSWNEDK